MFFEVGLMNPLDVGHSLHPYNLKLAFPWIAWVYQALQQSQTQILNSVFFMKVSSWIIFQSFSCCFLLGSLESSLCICISEVSQGFEGKLCTDVKTLSSVASSSLRFLHSISSPSDSSQLCPLRSHVNNTSSLFPAALCLSD